MKKQRLLLFLLAAVNFTHITDLVLLIPLQPTLMTLWKINAKQFGIVMAAYTLAAAVSSLIATYFIDRHDRRPVMLITFGGFILGTFACAFAPGYLPMVAARAVTGFFGGMIGALVLAIVSDCYPIQERGRAMGVITGALAVAFILGIPMGMVLADTFDWHAPFYFLAGFGALIWLALLKIMPSMKGHTVEGAVRSGLISTLDRALRDKNQRKALALAGLLILSAVMIITFLPIYLARNVGLTETHMQYLLFAAGGITIVASAVIGKLTDRFGPMKVFLGLVVGSLVPIWAVTSMPAVGWGLALLAVASFFVFVLGQLVPAQTIITGAVGPGHRGSFMSLKSAVQQFAASIGAFAGGAIMTNQFTKQAAKAGEALPLENFERVGYVAIVLCLLGVLIARNLKEADGNREIVS
ncbi:MAG: MFS transporter [Bacteroidia bacterium]